MALTLHFMEYIQGYNSANLMPRFIRAILFDLGGTLMYARDPWPPIEAHADLTFAQSLLNQGVNIDPPAFVKEFRARLNEYYIERDENLFETSYLFVARELLQEKGYGNLSEAVLRSALDRLFAITQANWTLEPDAWSTLQILESSGYRLGIISNAGDNKDVFQLVESFRIEPFFDFILTSAACSYRKPHPRIFELALAHWQIPAAEAAMVGDTLEADILGAQKAGLYSIWITRRANLKSDDVLRIQPDISLPTLADIPSALTRIR
jgi:HAD superfamily hydrolase (TIGR01662 family)